MDIIIIEGEYKDCEATTFMRGLERYFTDDTDGSLVLASKHTYIQKYGLLRDIYYLLDVATYSLDIDFFKKNINEREIKNPLILRDNRLKKLYEKQDTVRSDFFKYLKEGKNEELIYDILLTYISDVEYKENKSYNKPQLVLGHSGIFENDKKTVIILLDGILKADKRVYEVLKTMYEPLITIAFEDNSKNFDTKGFLDNLNLLLSAYNPSYNVVLCSDDIQLLKTLMQNGYGKNEALLTGITYYINMKEDWKNKQGLFFNKEEQ